MVAFRQKHLLLTLVQGTTWAQNYLGKVTIPVLKIKQMYDTSELRLSWSSKKFCQGCEFGVWRRIEKKRGGKLNSIM